MQITTKDNTKLYVKDWGTGPAVILIHGWPLSADSWDDQTMAIADAGMRAIAYDRRGFGRSDQPWVGYDYDTFSDDLAAVVKAVGATDASLVGFSMGGGEIARYMSRHQGRNIVRAALISSVVPYMPKSGDNPKGVDKSEFASMSAAIQQDRTQFFTGFFEKFFGSDAPTDAISDELLQWMRSLAMQSGLRPTLAAANAFATTDFRPDLAAFRVPTLIIHGTSDKIVPIDATSRAAASKISQSTLVEYAGAPHGLFATHKEKLTRDLIAFLKR